MLNVFKRWLAAATPSERNALARHAKTTLGSINQVAGGYRTAGKPNAGPELARRLELAATKIHREGLPPLKREDLCAVCAKCEYAKQARK